MATPTLATIILNTNRRADTLECLASLRQNTYPNHTILVLDNHSTDGSVDAIRAQFPEVEIIALQENLGYAGNNNVGIQAALDKGADWVLVLNEDTVLDPDCIAQVMEAAQSDPQSGVLGPMVYHHNEPTIIQSAGGALDAAWSSSHIGENEPDQGQYTQARRVDWISGCAIFVRCDAIKELGMLDARFFYYWEETEWCIRLAKGGWKIIHVPQAKLWHKGVQRDYQPKPSVTYYATRNHLLALAKHNAPLKVQWITWSQILGTLLSWSLRPKWRAKRPHRDAMWQGCLDFLRQRWGQMQTR